MVVPAPPGPVTFELDDGVATVRVDRPPVNALDVATQTRLGELAAEIAGRDDVSAVVLTGTREVFAAGADVREMLDLHLDRAAMAQRAADLQAAFTALAGIPQPVVAAVNGYALGGGCELALCADVRFAAEDATLGQPEIRLGIIPGAGGTQRLTRLVGPSRAKDLVLTGRFVGAAEALAIGLVDRVVAPDDVLAEATAWARQFVGGPTLALRAAKVAVDRGLDLDLAGGLALETEQFAALFGTADQRAGMTAFGAKQRPEFTGR